MPKENSLSLKDLLVLIGGLAVIWALFQIPATLIIFAIGFILFFILDPIIDWLQKFYDNRTFWVMIVFLVLIILSAFTVILLLPYLFDQLKQFVKCVPIYIDWVNKYLQTFLGYLRGTKITGATFELDLNPYINNMLEQVNLWAVNFVKNSFKFSLHIFSNLFNLLFAVVIAIYMLIDKKGIKDFFNNLMPLPLRTHKDRLLPKIFKILSSYFRAILFLGFIIFIISWPVLILLKVPYAFLIAVWLGITEMIPYIGPWIGSITAVLVAWLVSPILAIQVALFCTILQLIENAIIVPKVMSSELGIHPLLVLFAMFAGAEIYGIVGMILAVPVAAAFYMGYKYYRENST